MPRGSSFCHLCGVLAVRGVMAMAWSGVCLLFRVLASWSGVECLFVSRGRRAVVADVLCVPKWFVETRCLPFVRHQALSFVPGMGVSKLGTSLVGSSAIAMVAVCLSAPRMWRRAYKGLGER